jgi:hypothetical protein
LQAAEGEIQTVQPYQFGGFARDAVFADVVIFRPFQDLAETSLIFVVVLRVALENAAQAAGDAFEHGFSCWFRFLWRYCNNPRSLFVSPAHAVHVFKRLSLFYPLFGIRACMWQSFAYNARLINCGVEQSGSSSGS